MGFMFCDLHVSNNPSSGDINSSNLPCYFNSQSHAGIQRVDRGSGSPWKITQDI